MKKIMKKLLSLILAAAVGAALMSCGADEEDTGERFTFSTTNIYGTSYTSESMEDAKLVLVNYWEPWCKPCISEIPDLQKLYDNYKDKGLLVIGVTHDAANEADAKKIINSRGITYPVIHGNDETAKFAQGYIPSTFFTDGKGKILKAPVTGAQSYYDFEAVVQKYLGE